ncbi:sensor histidine kinase [Streptomyces fuscigenes]|uniref:sensor histidine kinase n=1 Tax=Streptomyces fuscigenes TaxID=1528880 RepID=UPI001F26CF7E|nr:sensor histidine kinase [Streptomyces fuscigenes]MCF3962027.1 sensor histidine kinase [Streptomyces fuscigenes]
MSTQRTADTGAARDDGSGVPIGRPPENRRQALVKLAWTGIWLAYLGAPASDLWEGGHSWWSLVLAVCGLLAFVGAYLALVFRHTGRHFTQRTVRILLAGVFVLALCLSLTMGTPWLVLFVYVSVSAGAALPIRQSAVAIPLTVVTMLLVGTQSHGDKDFVPSLVIPALLGGFAMTGVSQLVRTMRELREARATVATLAANEERLRMARDLHDLLGHSLSLITLKSELAGRMLPDHPDRAAEQVGDIERVSRQALTDVREAVSGYRRLTLSGELAGARTTLAVAGIEGRLPAELPGDLPGTLEGPSEEALAWSLREAVTNVVRHSGARHCDVVLTPRQTLDGPFLQLTVEDDGRGTGAAPKGNGLTGLGERLDRAGGTLDLRSSRSGLTLAMRVPLAPPGGAI